MRRFQIRPLRRVAPYAGVLLLGVAVVVVLAGRGSKSSEGAPSPAVSVDNARAAVADVKADSRQATRPFDFPEKLAEARHSGRYLLAYFFGAGEQGRWDEVIHRVQDEHPAQVDVSYIPVGNPQAASLITRYGIRATPSLLVFAPNGAVTAGFTQNAPTTEQIAPAFVSKVMADIIASVQRGKFTFLVVGSGNQPMFAENAKVARTAASTLEGMAEVIAVDRKVEDAGDVIKHLRLPPNDNETHTYVVSPAGGLVAHFQGKVTDQNLYDSFATVLAQRKGCGAQTVTGGSSCEPGRGAVGGRSCGGGARQ